MVAEVQVDAGQDVPGVGLHDAVTGVLRDGQGGLGELQGNTATPGVAVDRGQALQGVALVARSPTSRCSASAWVRYSRASSNRPSAWQAMPRLLSVSASP